MHRLALLLALPSVCIGLGGCADDFDLGVGAFEVGTEEALLWTHVVPGEAGDYGVPLRAEVARDAEFADIVRRSTVVAGPSTDFTARARVHGLDPDTEYHYRFSGLEIPFPLSLLYPSAEAAPVSSPGRFRTAPADDAAASVRFVISGDSNLGYTQPRGLDFYVLSAAAAESPDFFVYFGDTVYADSGILPGGADAFTLDEYRSVHRMTRADPHLQNLLSSTGTFSGWDDHEVRNDYDGETVDPEQFRNGARAFFEYLPLRQRPGRAPFRTHRTVRWGRHLELFFVDGRQFRTAEQFCNPDPTPDGPETDETLFSPYPEDEAIAEPILAELFPVAEPLFTPSDPECVADTLGAPGRSVLGADQLAELKADLLASTASFKVIVNNTPLADLFFLPYDRWEGYPAERDDLVSFLDENFEPGEIVVFTTDFHTNLAIERDAFTEVIVGPIGQGTFGQGVLDLVPPELADFKGVLFLLLDAIIAAANGVPAVSGSQPDAFSYAVVDVFEDAGAPKMRITVRGDTDYLSGDNDPAKVADLFSFEVP